jgi:hypothetical protein
MPLHSLARSSVLSLRVTLCPLWFKLFNQRGQHSQEVIPSTESFF